MPKNQLDRTIDRPYSARGGAGGSITVTGGGGGSSGVTDHGLLTGLADDDHTQYFNQTRGDARYLQSARTLTAGAGLTGGGDLSADRTFTVGAGLGITVNADDVALTTPGTLTVSTTNSATGSHTHGITSSSNPGAAAAILASTSGGGLTLVTLAASTSVTTPTLATASGALALSPNSGTVNLPASGVLGTASGGYTLAPTTDVTLDPAGDDVLVASATRIGTDNYASQLTGWRIDYAGAGDFRYLFTDELHAKSFIADLEQALAGGQIIAKSVAMLSRAFTLPAAGAAGTLYLRDLPSAENMAVFESGDIVRLRTFSRAAGSLTIADAWGVVTAYSDLADKEQSWTFTRSSAPNAGTATGTIAADSLALDYGTTGNGFHEVNAIDGAYALNSPYSQVVTWTTHPATGSAVRVRTGNLRGITGSTEYGLWAGVTTAQNLLVTGDKIALRQGTTEKITLESDGDSYFSGVMTIGTSGEIRQGTGTLGSNFTGLRLWNDTSVGRIGGYNSNTLQWYGSTDGRLYGGSGKTWIDANGVSVEVNAANAFNSTYAVNWYTAVGGTRKAGIGAYTVSGVTVLGVEVNSHQLTLDNNGRLNLQHSGGNVSLSSLANSYTNVVNNLGVGLAYDETPAARLHVRGTTPILRFASTTAAENMTMGFYAADTTLKGRIVYAGANSSPNQWFGLVNDAGDYMSMWSNVHTWNNYGTTERMRLDATGLGIGGTPGTNERLSVQGGANRVAVQISSSNAYGPYIALTNTQATYGRTWEIRSSGTSDNLAGALEFIDRTASGVRMSLKPDGNVNVSGKLIAGDLVAYTSRTPSSDSDGTFGEAGQIVWDQNYLYMHLGGTSNQWGRIAWTKNWSG